MNCSHIIRIFDIVKQIIVCAAQLISVEKIQFFNNFILSFREKFEAIISHWANFFSFVFDHSPPVVLAGAGVVVISSKRKICLTIFGENHCYRARPNIQLNLRSFSKVMLSSIVYFQGVSNQIRHILRR